MLILGVILTDFTSKKAMEEKGWIFNWNDEHVFARREEYCKGIPETSYCGYRETGHGKISYTFQKRGSGFATLHYGLSGRAGSVYVRRNGIVIDSRNSNGDSKISFDFAAFDVLRIEESGECVINIHSLIMDISSK